MLDQTLDLMRSAIAQGAFDKAETLGRDIIDQFPESVPLHKGIGVALTFQNKIAEALTFFEKAHSLAPQEADIVYNIATLSLKLGRAKQAVEMFSQLYRAGVRSFEVYLNSINSLLAVQRADDALVLCKEAYEKFPEHKDLQVTYLSVLELNNKLEDADKLLSGLKIDGAACIMAARIKRRLKQFEEARAIIEACIPEGFDQRTLSEYHWEKAIILEKAKAFNEAWENYEKANLEFSKLENVKAVSSKGFWDDLNWLQEYAKGEDWVANKLIIPAKNSYRSPVFFVSFPRSGTTLMEQMLKAHSKVITTEERSPFQTLISQIRKEGDFTDYFSDMDQSRLEEIRDRFWDIAEESLGDIKDKLIVDKLPLNIMWVPILRQVFPASPIIMAYRDPRDVCISAFIQPFSPNAAMVNFLDWEQTAKTYDQVMTLWTSCKEKLRGNLFEYRYEDLTDDYQKVVTDLLEYCQLEFEDAILSYREQAMERNIETPSYYEVVNPIHKGAVARWKDYPEATNKVSSYLEKWIKAFGYS